MYSRYGYCRYDREDTDIVDTTYRKRLIFPTLPIRYKKPTSEINTDIEISNLGGEYLEKKNLSYIFLHVL